MLGRLAQHPPLLLSYCVGPISQHRPHPLTQRGDTAPHPLPWQGGGPSLGHTCWANCSTCSRLTLPKTALRDGVKQQKQVLGHPCLCTVLKRHIYIWKYICCVVCRSADLDQFPGRSLACYLDISIEGVQKVERSLSRSNLKPELI